MHGSGSWEKSKGGGKAKAHLGVDGHALPVEAHLLLLVQVRGCGGPGGRAEPALALRLHLRGRAGKQGRARR